MLVMLSPALRVWIRHFDPGFGDADDVPRLELRLWIRKRWVIIIADDHPLASRRVLRRQLLPQVLSAGDLRSESPGTPFSDLVCEGGRRVENCGVEGLAEVHLQRADAPADGREIAVDELAEGGDGPVEARDHPVGGTLVDGDGGRGRDDFGDDLRGGRSYMYSSVPILIESLKDRRF